jgi:hypothetical protein
VMARGNYLTLGHGSRLAAGGSRLAAGGSRLAAGGWRLAAHGWRLTAGGSRLAARVSRLAARGWRLAARGSRLAAGGWRRDVLASGSSRCGPLPRARGTGGERMATGHDGGRRDVVSTSQHKLHAPSPVASLDAQVREGPGAAVRSASPPFVHTCAALGPDAAPCPHGIVTGAHLCSGGRARSQTPTCNTRPPWSVWPDTPSRMVHKARMRDCQERRGG